MWWGSSEKIDLKAPLTVDDRMVVVIIRYFEYVTSLNLKLIR